MVNNIRKWMEKISMSSEDNRAYVLVQIHPGNEKEFCEEVISKGWILNSTVERMDFVHGSFDFVITLHGSLGDIDKKIMEIRRSPYVHKTETLICFEMFTWEELFNQVNKQP